MILASIQLNQTISVGKDINKLLDEDANQIFYKLKIMQGLGDIKYLQMLSKIHEFNRSYTGLGFPNQLEI